MLLAREPHAGAIDEYWHFCEGGVTVFGFGRGPRESGWGLTSAPSHLMIGLVESARHEHVSDTWRAWTTPLQVAVAHSP